MCRRAGECVHSDRCRPRLAPVNDEKYQLDSKVFAPADTRVRAC
jgi:hypothetical protein